MDAPAHVDLALHLEADWVTLPYRFPDPPDALPDGPAIYSWWVNDLPVYVGEGEELRRRIKQYLSPGPSQQTNIRLKGALVQRQAAGDRVALRVLSGLRLNGETVSTADLSSKWLRSLLETWFIWWYGEQGFELLNL